MVSTRVYVDIETYSSVDLPKYGVYAYAAAPDFRILMAAWSVDGGPVETDLDHDAAVERLRGFMALGDVTFVAHNAQFERVCFSAALGLPTGSFLPPTDWHDTQAVAGERGWPQTLEKAAKALGAEEKDAAGTRLINLFCKPNRKGTRTLPEDKPSEWLDFIFYCEQDVYTLVDLDRRLGDHVTDEERQTFIADQLINDRGIAIDVELAGVAVRVAEENQERQKDVIRLVAGVDNPGSQPQMMAWVREQGLDADNLQRATVAKLLEGDLTHEQRVVLTTRQELALVASKKYATALGGAGDDGRLRGSFKFFGAHTGRWAGRGTQLQNLPREQLETETETEDAIQYLKDHEEASAHTLKALVRALFTGPFTVVDYSAIEARVVAWLAGEQWALDAFHAGRDIYVETAERMGGLTRSQGKVAVLALGYNGGVNSLRAMSGDRKALLQIAKPPGVDQGDVFDLTERDIDNQLQALVHQWRHANRNIVRLWAELGDAFADTGRVGPHLKVTDSEDALGRAVHLWLPSGRPITYHGVKWERYAVEDPKTGRRVRKEGWRYADPKDPFNYRRRIGTYGGRLVENATQAVARDVLAAALVRLEERGYRVVGHVHDEILVEGQHDVEEITRIMTELPDWADGLPIDGAGFQCRRYRKD